MPQAFVGQAPLPLPLPERAPAQRTVPEAMTHDKRVIGQGHGNGVKPCSGLGGPICGVVCTTAWERTGSDVASGGPSQS